jgi:hypothetical protein
LGNFSRCVSLRNIEEFWQTLQKYRTISAILTFVN